MKLQEGALGAMAPLRPARSALVALDWEHLNSSLHDGVQFTIHEAFSHDDKYTLFRSEDWAAWVIFSAVFVVLLTFDHYVLNRSSRPISTAWAVSYTLFYVACACGFCCWVYWAKGEDAAFMWMSGYMLEWMLSFDNLFVFHRIFSVYATPDHLKHRPLYLGIWGAIVFRLIFIFVGEYLMHAMFFMHLIFGGFLIYTGVKTVMVDDDDEDPSDNPVVQWLQRNVPFVSVYCDKGSFFVRVPINQSGDPMVPESPRRRAASARSAASAGGQEQRERLETGESAGTISPRYNLVDFDAINSAAPEGCGSQRRATMLFLVVCCIEVSDLLFAVDSVSAIVAQVNDLFLAYTSAVFAMLGLRATFFIIDVLAKIFSLLKYGVAAVLVFIGVKLCLSKVYHIPPGIVCAVLVCCLGSSMIASVVLPEASDAGAEKSPLQRSHSSNSLNRQQS